MAKGYIIYQGESLLDGKEIVVIFLPTSKNSKTGDMAQTYILVVGIDPRLASKTGADYSICGDCKHRGIPTTDPNRKLAMKRSCYVKIYQGVLATFRAFEKGNYLVANTHDEIQKLGTNQFVRLGTYGDPSAVPSYVWDSLLSKSKNNTGYTHQSNNPNADVRTDQCMISADSYAQAKEFWNKKIRTFRVLQKNEEIDKQNEVLCPASKEAGRRTTCNDCMLCSGSNIKAKSVAIYQH